MIYLVQRETKIIVALTASLVVSIARWPETRQYVERYRDRDDCKWETIPLVHGITDGSSTMLAGISERFAHPTKLLGYPLHPFDGRPSYILRYAQVEVQRSRIKKLSSWRPNDQLVEEEIIYFDDWKVQDLPSAADYAKKLGIV